MNKEQKKIKLIQDLRLKLITISLGFDNKCYTDKELKKIEEILTPLTQIVDSRIYGKVQDTIGFNKAIIKNQR